MVAVDYSNTGNRHTEMSGDNFYDTGIGHIALRFLANGNFEMVFRLLFQGLLASAGGNFHMDIGHRYLNPSTKKARG